MASQPIPVPSPKTLSSLTFGDGGTSLTASPGGASLPLTINMTGLSFPEETAQVDLSSDHPAVVIVPASVTFRGPTYSELLTTEFVILDTPVVITAQYGGSQVQATIVITPIEFRPLPKVVSSLQFFIGDTAVGGGAPDLPGGFTFGLQINMAGGIEFATVQVDLSSDHPAVVIVPASVTFSGPSYMVQVEDDDGPIQHSHRPHRPVWCLASTGNNHHYAPFLERVSLNPASVTGGATSQGTVKVSLGGAPPGGMNINLTSSNPDVAHLPQIVTVAARSETATFPVTTNRVFDSTGVTITASWPNSGPNFPPVSAPLTVNPGVVPNLIIVVTLNDENGDPALTPVPGYPYTMSINVQNHGSGAAAQSTLMVEETANGASINSWSLQIPAIPSGQGPGAFASISPAAFDSDVAYDFNFYDPPGTYLTTVSYNL